MSFSLFARLDIDVLRICRVKGKRLYIYHAHKEEAEYQKSHLHSIKT